MKQKAEARTLPHVLSLIIAVALASSSAACAQTIIGTWQGTLPAEKPRIVVKIGRTDEGLLRGVFYRIDQYAGSIPLSDVKFAAPDVNLAAMALDVTYTGKLSADGKLIAGTWKQGERSYPLSLALVAAEASWLHEGPAPAAAMSATADPSFEVSTVKPSGPGARLHSLHAKTRRFDANQYTVESLIEFAYNVRQRQVEGGPAWMTDEKFDLTGEPDAEGVPNLAQVRLMAKKLLISRFGLSVRIVPTEFPVYVLGVGSKSDLKITRSDPEMNNSAGIVTKEGTDGQMRAQFRYMTMPEFCDILMNFIPSRQIVDETGLAGPYDFTLALPMEVLQGGANTEAASPAFFHAVQAQLGMKLEAAKRPLPVVVVEHLERPSAN